MGTNAVPADSDAMKPHVVVLPSPGLGHVTPLLELALRLVTHHGFRVSFLNITTEASAAQNQLLRSPRIPPDLHVVDLPLADVSTLLSSETTVVVRLSLIVQQSLLCLDTLLTEFTPKPRALIIDLFCTQAFDVCEQLSIPTFTFFTASSHLLAFSLFLPRLDREAEGEFVDLPRPVEVPGCAPIRTGDLLDQVRNRKIDEYKWYLYHLSRLPMAAGILLNTWEGLEPVTLAALREHPFYGQIPIPPVYPVGPVIKEAGAQCVAWLDRQPPESVLLVALGSGGTLSGEQVTELAWGLELSQQRFIWVVRTPSDVSANASFFNAGSDADDPKSYLPEGFEERTGERGLVVPSWCPQVEILGHAYTGGFMSHCGWNSTLESVAHGVPMIAWPLYAEQRMNATMLVEQIGVAVRAGEGSGGVIGRKEIEKAARMTIKGEEGKAMRHKAKELKQSASETLRNGGSSYESLASLSDQWRA
ncbi:anthocyanidin 3-O-glucosyltransferase 5-like [Prosopis cineraria]|uniref:anthocyanidin 3-O-glucosyltransferase 5-like n=1 Tax=Prosopis cineraria TaxID=364024 RepID=UPI0024109117|nr:anthocyanidin 3-O-glucosyltransferase 5-like [Prosopis cineraria]